ncbi:MAG: hypothetical protein HC850_06340 [Rhodomicrobium sp.]|nr:hypothetical protein [Rhodomicrobium sp.]
MLEMIERLLASLIVLAMLVLVFFIAFPSNQSGDRNGTEFRQKEEERIPPNGGSRQAAPKDTDKPATPPAEKPAAPTKQVETPPVVPDPNSSKPVTTTQDDNKLKDDSVVSSEPQPPQPQKVPPKEAERIAQQKIERPVPNRGDKRNKENVRSVRNGRPAREVQEPHYRRYSKPVRDDDDDDGAHFRQAQYKARWRRNHYYECEGGRCDCSCARPYWSRHGPICWDDRQW